MSEVQLANDKATESLTMLLVVVVYKFEVSKFISFLFVTAVMKMMTMMTTMTIMMMMMSSTVIVMKMLIMMMTMMRIC